MPSQCLFRRARWLYNHSLPTGAAPAANPGGRGDATRFAKRRGLACLAQWPEQAKRPSCPLNAFERLRVVATPQERVGPPLKEGARGSRPAAVVRASISSGAGRRRREAVAGDQRWGRRRAQDPVGPSPTPRPSSAEPPPQTLQPRAPPSPQRRGSIADAPIAVLTGGRGRSPTPSWHPPEGRSETSPPAELAFPAGVGGGGGGITVGGGPGAAPRGRSAPPSATAAARFPPFVFVFVLPSNTATSRHARLARPGLRAAANSKGEKTGDPRGRSGRAFKTRRRNQKGSKPQRGKKQREREEAGVTRTGRNQVDCTWRGKGKRERRKNTELPVA